MADTLLYGFLKKACEALTDISKQTAQPGVRRRADEALALIGPVAQSVERRIFNPDVAGSNPAGSAIIYDTAIGIVAPFLSNVHPPSRQAVRRAEDIVNALLRDGTLVQPLPPMPHGTGKAAEERKESENG